MPCSKNHREALPKKKDRKGDSGETKHCEVENDPFLDGWNRNKYEWLFFGLASLLVMGECWFVNNCCCFKEIELTRNPQSD